MNRRHLLAGLLAPWLPGSRVAHAGEVPPRRLVLFYTPHGTIYDAWRTTSGPDGLNFGPILAPLARHRDSVVVLDGLRVIADSVGAPHTKGFPLLWTASPLLEDKTFSRDDGNGVYYFGWNSGPSVDQAIADQLNLSLPYRSLEFGVRPGGTHPGHRMIYRGAAQPLAADSDPYQVYARLFGGGSTIGELENTLARRQSVLDHVYGEIESFAGQVPLADRPKLDAHLQAIRDVEQSLSAPLSECEGPDVPKGLLPQRMTDVPQLLSAQLDLLASAFACDLTRIASVQISVAGERPHHL